MANNAESMINTYTLYSITTLHVPLDHLFCFHYIRHTM